MTRCRDTIVTLFAGACAFALGLSLAAPSGAWAAIPPGVKPAEFTAHEWELPQTGGTFRADGSSAIDKSGVYHPKPDDRLEVEYREGLRLSFFNVGELGGEQYAEARIDYVREYLSPGLVVPRAQPRVIGKPVPEAGGEVENVPAKGMLKPYSEPMYFLRFTGGPDGSFVQSGGRSNPDGSITGQIVREPLDGLRYVELRPLYIRMRVDDPSAFLGWPGEEPLPLGAGLRSDDDTSVAAKLASYRGRVTFSYPDGTSATLEEEPSGRVLDRIPIGTVVGASAGSFIEIEYSSGARYVLGPNSTVELLQREASGARLRRGSALVWHPGTIAVAGTRTAVNFGVVAGSGAEWLLEEGPKSTTCTILAGNATFSVPGTERATRLRPGQSVKATKKGLEEPQAADVEAIRSQWKDLRAEAIVLEQRSVLAMPGVVPGVGVLMVAGAVGVLLFRRRARDATESVG